MYQQNNIKSMLKVDVLDDCLGTVFKDVLDNELLHFHLDLINFLNTFNLTRMQRLYFLCNALYTLALLML